MNVLSVQLTAYTVALIASGYIAYAVKRGRVYWPVTRLLSATIFAVLAHVLAVYWFSFAWPWLRTDPVQLVTRSVGMAVVLLWAAWLTHKRNRTPVDRQLSLTGKESPIDDRELLTHLEAVTRVAGRHWSLPPYVRMFGRPRPRRIRSVNTIEREHV